MLESLFQKKDIFSMMYYMLALLFPWLCFFILGKPIHGFISLILQISVIGWPVATMWAFFGIREHRQQAKRTIQKRK